MNQLRSLLYTEYHNKALLNRGIVWFH